MARIILQKVKHIMQCISPRYQCLIFFICTGMLLVFFLRPRRKPEPRREWDSYWHKQRSSRDFDPTQKSRWEVENDFGVADGIKDLSRYPDRRSNVRMMMEMLKRRANDIAKELHKPGDVEEITTTVFRRRTKKKRKKATKMLNQEEVFTETVSKFIKSTDTYCWKMLMIGHVSDLWEVCRDKLVAFKQPCIVYQFGASVDFVFEERVSKMYKCQVHVFDPDKVDSIRVKRSNKVTLYQLGIAETRAVRDGRVYLPWSDLVELLDHNVSHIQMVNFDLKNATWTVLPHLIANNHLSQVSQIGMEIHLMNPDGVLLPTKLKLLSMMTDHGFKKYNVNERKHCEPIVTGAICYRLYYTNRDLLKPGSSVVHSDGGMMWQQPGYSGV
ncbi:uncharacterized protein LOC131938539 [Physella acuta]|uniref:uncharacterized protein LOC131938539 n=1 Tax=Physella acuta TaxID=109671 RepID=UPI0027DDE33D|nr:uncharacterized protein LOC131938539 [Physella acuta]